MALTLSNQKLLSNDMLVGGIIDSIVTVNQFYSALPFAGIHGNALAYNCEKAGADQMALVSVMDTAGSTINKDQQEFTRKSTELTTIIGDAQVNGLIQAVGSDMMNATAVQVAAKAKGVGRKFMDLMINGTVATSATNGATGFDGMNAMTAVAPTLDPASTDVLAKLDVLIDACLDKDGMVDYIMTNSAGVRMITAAFRAAGTGFDMMDVKTSSGAVASIQSYRGVPIYRNDFISSIDNTDTDTDLNNPVVYVGTLDDGSLSHGISGLTASKAAGIQVQKLGAREDADAEITRVKWYVGLAHFSELGLVKGSL